MTCTFFGHRDCNERDLSDLKRKIVDLIENKNVVKFYVGNNGNFDRCVQKTLCELKNKYPEIEWFVVLEKLPTGEYVENSVFPEELVGVPPKFLIDRRNNYMLKNSDYVITYVRRKYGGAAKFEIKAEKANKIIIKI